MDYQEILQKVQGFLETVDQQLLAAAAVLVLLLLLFWRVLRRTSRIEREVARLNERLERIREEVRSLSRPPLSVAPAKEAVADAGSAGESGATEEAPAVVPDLTEAQAEEDDLLSRAAASLAEAGLDEELAVSDDSFSFGEEDTAEPHELPAAEEEPSAVFAAEEDQIAAPTEEPETPALEPQAEEPSAQEPAAQEPAAQEPAAQEPAAQEPADQEPAASGVVKLESDPARPGVSMVRCLSCNYKLAYPEKLSGKRVRCPSCRAGLDLP